MIKCLVVEENILYGGNINTKSMNSKFLRYFFEFYKYLENNNM